MKRTIWNDNHTVGLQYDDENFTITDSGKIYHQESVVIEKTVDAIACDQLDIIIQQLKQKREILSEKFETVKIGDKSYKQLLLF